MITDNFINFIESKPLEGVGTSFGIYKHLHDSYIITDYKLFFNVNIFFRILIDNKFLIRN
jgi:hypothetical protein